MPSLGAVAWPEIGPAPLLVVPLGSVEQHGPHLPFITDTAVAAAVAEGAVGLLDGTLLAPALAYGASGEHEDFPGTVSLGTEALTALLVEYGRSACRWAGRVLVVNGHGGNLAALRTAFALLRREGRDVAWFPCGTPGGDAHAGRTETSLMLHVEPAGVRADRSVPGVDDADRRADAAAAGRGRPRGQPHRCARGPHGRHRGGGGGAARRPRAAAGGRGRAVAGGRARTARGMSTALPAPPPDRLPDGFAVRLDPATHVRDDGAALLGGSPLRLLRLAPRARGLLTGDRLVVRDATTAALAARLLDGNLAAPDLAAIPPPDGEVTVVVPVRDRAAALGRLLEALRRDPATRTAPVVVVDDGSGDPAAHAAVAERAGARLLRHGWSRGPAAARNAGLRAARTELVAFVDSDCVPRTGWLDPLRRHLADPRVAVVAPRIRPLAAPGTWIARYEDLAGALDMGGRAASVRQLSAVSYVPSAALLARPAALGDGFDESMRVAEDVDLVWRLVEAGWRVRYEPAAEVAHEHPAGATAWLRRRAFYGTGAALLAARHGDAVAPVVLSRWSAAAWALLLTGTVAGRLGAPAVVASAGLLGVASVRLARRLAGPGTRPDLLLASRLVGGGTALAGRTLARAVTRHHWPLTLPAALLSRRARRLLLAASAADTVAAWWPHRDRLDLPRFAGARLLDDLAYGAGLWVGALRARDVRALLPAEPPTL